LVQIPPIQGRKKNFISKRAKNNDAEQIKELSLNAGKRHFNKNDSRYEPREKFTSLVVPK
jgi:hypothetical protein